MPRPDARLEALLMRVGVLTISDSVAKGEREDRSFKAVFSGVADLKKIFAEARTAAKAGQHTLLFVDEVHRFNRSQQDGFLPYVEDGTVTLVGATTENPSFEINAALLSRCQVLILRRLDHEALGELVRRAEAPKHVPHPSFIDLPCRVRF